MIPTTVEVRVAKMAKKLGRPKTSERDDGVVRIDRSLISMGKVVAGHRGVSLAELLSEMLRSPMKDAYLSMVRELEKRPK